MLFFKRIQNAVLNIKGSYYLLVINLISKNKAINLLQNANLMEKTELQKYNNFWKHI